MTSTGPFGPGNSPWIQPSLTSNVTLSSSRPSTAHRPCDPEAELRYARIRLIPTALTMTGRCKPSPFRGCRTRFPLGTPVGKTPYGITFSGSARRSTLTTPSLWPRSWHLPERLKRRGSDGSGPARSSPRARPLQPERGILLPGLGRSAAASRRSTSSIGQGTPRSSVVPQPRSVES